MRTALALAVVVAAGCGAPAWPRGEWAKPGVTEAAQRRDEYECTRQATLRRGMETDAATVFATCMRARGYARVGP